MACITALMVLSGSSFELSSAAASTITRIQPAVARTDSPRLTQPMTKPACASPRCFGVSPASTFFFPFREHTIPAMAQPSETIVDSPAESTSRPSDTIDNTNPATAWPLSGAGGYCGYAQACGGGYG